MSVGDRESGGDQDSAFAEHDGEVWIVITDAQARLMSWAGPAALRSISWVYPAVNEGALGWLSFMRGGAVDEGRNDGV